VSLGGNPINTFEEIQLLTQLRNIKELDFIDCPISNLKEYREKMFELFQGLEILDSVDRDGNLVEDDEEFSDQEGYILLEFRDADEDDEDEDDEDSDE